MLKLLSIFFAGSLALVIFIFSGLEKELAIGLSILAFVSVLWVTEAIHLTLTALLIPLLAVGTGILSTKAALENFANPIIFLFLGGFVLAGAIQKHHLDQFIANRAIMLAKGSIIAAIFILFIMTACISMWISNTATSAMMLPIALGLLSGHLKDDKNQRLVIFVLLGLAYSASIGGIGTLVGSPPNAIAASTLEISFAEWMAFGIPLVIILLPIMTLTLWIVIRPEFSRLNLNKEISSSVKLSQQAYCVIAIFISVAGLWMASKPLADFLNIEKGFDSLVAIFAVVILVATGLIKWKEAEDSIDWGVLLLFGGGITLSTVLSKTGSSAFLANQLLLFTEGHSIWLLLLLSVTLMIFLTEVASNTASAALLVPIFYALPHEALGLPPILLPLTVAIAASCAFMLPVATPPNAIVYGSGYITQKQMIRTGLFLNLFFIIVLTVLSQFMFTG